MQDPKTNEQSTSSFSRIFSTLDQYGLQYYLCPLNYLIIWIIYMKTNQPAYIAAYYFTLIYSGKLLPNDDFSVSNSAEQNKNNWLLVPLVLQSICIWITVIGVFITFPFLKYTLAQTVILSVVLMIMISVSIGGSHELMHRHQTIFKVLAKLQLTIPQFTIYPFMHIYHHHKYVGTEIDFITSPKNKNPYSYAWQVLPKSYSYLYNNNKPQFYNCIKLNFGYIVALFCLAFQQGYSLETAMIRVGYMLLLGLGSYYLFQLVQSTEHYGLIYRKNQDQKAVQEICSWNSEQNLILNWIGFRFQRHSDHHMNAYKIYSTMELTDQMPKIPFSVFEAFLFASIPPLWHKIMNPYVQNVLQGKKIEESHSKFVQKVKILAMLSLLSTFWFLAVTAFSGGKKIDVY